MTPVDLEKFIFDKIPIAKALGVRVVRVDLAAAEVSARLEPNLNHLGTAFGGSLNAVLVLAGYAWMYNFLASHGLKGHVVLKSIEIQYLEPVTEDFSAICRAPAPRELDRFLKTMQRKNRAQIDLTASVDVKSGPACTFRGCFVATPGASP